MCELKRNAFCFDSCEQHNQSSSHLYCIRVEVEKQDKRKTKLCEKASANLGKRAANIHVPVEISDRLLPCICGRAQAD